MARVPNSALSLSHIGTRNASEKAQVLKTERLAGICSGSGEVHSWRPPG